MKYISLFAGIGGFDLALDRLGYECVWANEYNKYAGQIYRARFSNNSNKFRQGKTEGELSTKGESNQSQDSKSSINSINTTSLLCSRDITTVKTSEIPDHDLLVGGFPCQAFSIAGKRRGFDDTRGTLFFDIARILKDKQPKYFILENVKGLLSHNKGDTFRTIIATLTELGYDLEWQVLNSKNFGVPQNRERVFIVGHLRGTSRPEVFPIGGSNPKTVSKHGVMIRVHNLQTRNPNRPSLTRVCDCGSGKLYQHCHGVPGGSGHISKDDGTTYCLDSSARQGIEIVNPYKGTNTTKKSRRQIIVEHIQGQVKVRKHIVNVEELKKLLREHRKPAEELAEKLGVKKTTVEHWFRTDSSFSIPSEYIWMSLKEELGITTDKFDKPIMEFEIRDNKFDQSNRVYKKEGIAPTLTTYTGGHQHTPIDDGYSIRRLTPTECERLQGFPDGWTKNGVNEKGEIVPISDTQRYKCLGNAVTVNVVYEIAKRLN